MSWLTSLFSGNDQPHAVIQPWQYSEANWNDARLGGDPNYTYDEIKQYDPKYIAEQKAAADAAALSGVTSGTTTTAPTGPQVALKQFNDALGSDFESRFEPDTTASPFVQGAFTSGRSKADDFIANMLRRGTLTESGRAGAVSALDKQAPTVQSRLSSISSALLGSDRARLTDLANVARGTAQQTPEGQEFDPTPLINQIASTGQSQAGTFGTRFNQALPPGDLFDTSGVASAGGAVTTPENVSYDPYAQEGGKLTTGLGDTSAPPPSSNKRRISVF